MHTYVSVIGNLTRDVELRYTPSGLAIGNTAIASTYNCKDIPIDYDGVIGIPLTFFLRHNPAQFKILGCDFEIKDKYPELVKHTYKENNTKSAVLKGQELFTRIIIQRKGGLKPRARIFNQF